MKPKKEQRDQIRLIFRNRPLEDYPEDDGLMEYNSFETLIIDVPKGMSLDLKWLVGIEWVRTK